MVQSMVQWVVCDNHLDMYYMKAVVPVYILVNLQDRVEWMVQSMVCYSLDNHKEASLLQSNIEVVQYVQYKVTVSRLLLQCNVPMYTHLFSSNTFLKRNRRG